LKYCPIKKSRKELFWPSPLKPAKFVESRPMNFSVILQNSNTLFQKSVRIAKAIIFFSSISPNVAKVGGLQSQGDKGAAVVDILQALANDGSGVLRLFRRGKKDGLK
jgi:hypothetical protein